MPFEVEDDGWASGVELTYSGKKYTMGFSMGWRVKERDDELEKTTYGVYINPSVTLLDGTGLFVDDGTNVQLMTCYREGDFGRQCLNARWIYTSSGYTTEVMAPTVKIVDEGDYPADEMTSIIADYD